MNKEELFKGLDPKDKVVLEHKPITSNKDDYILSELWSVNELLTDHFNLISIEDNFAYFTTRTGINILYRLKVEDKFFTEKRAITQ